MKLIEQITIDKIKDQFPEQKHFIKDLQCISCGMKQDVCITFECSTPFQLCLACLGLGVQLMEEFYKEQNEIRKAYYLDEQIMRKNI